MNQQPTVSIIIPVRNEEQFIRTTLQHCFEQDYPAGRLEILLADGMSSDRTREVIHEFVKEYGGEDVPAVRIIDNPQQIVPTGLNRAIRASNADVIVCMGAHAEYERDYVRQCVRVLEETAADNVGGPARAIARGYVARAVAAAYNSPFSVGGARFHDPDYEGYVDTVTFGCWYRAYLLSIDGYDEEFVRNQDDEMNLRTILSGGKIYQSPAIKSYYYTRDSIIRLFKQQYQYGNWKVRVIQKHRRPASLRHLVPVLFVAGLVGGFLLAFVHPWLAYIYVGSLTLYCLLMTVFSLLAAASRGWDLVFMLPLVFATYHIAYGTGFALGVYDFVLRRRHTKNDAQRSFSKSLSR
jgi:glycosyltransferase involved in cell wall biosynthesis